MLHVTAIASVGAALSIGGPSLHKNLRGIAPGVVEVGGGTNLEDRTKLFDCRVIPIDPQADVYMNVKPVLDVAFAEATPSAGGDSVRQTLHDIFGHVVQEVVLPLAKYL